MSNWLSKINVGTNAPPGELIVDAKLVEQLTAGYTSPSRPRTPTIIAQLGSSHPSLIYVRANSLHCCARRTVTRIGSSSAAPFVKTVGNQRSEGAVEIIGAKGKMAIITVDVAGPK